jgi:hypothetical protein
MVQATSGERDPRGGSTPTACLGFIRLNHTLDLGNVAVRCPLIEKEGLLPPFIPEWIIPVQESRVDPWKPRGSEAHESTSPCP